MDQDGVTNVKAYKVYVKEVLSAIFIVVVIVI